MSMSTSASPRIGSFASRLSWLVCLLSMVSTLISSVSGLDARHDFAVVDALLDSEPHEARVLGLLGGVGFGPVGLDARRVRRDLRLDLLDLRFERRVLLLARLELLPLQLEQLEPLLVDAVLELVCLRCAVSSRRSSCSLSVCAYVFTRILIEPPGLLASMSCSAA